MCLFLAKSRRQPKPYKPKKMIKLETKTAIYTACNNGSSSIVTKDGELYMFGKDAIYSDSTSKCHLQTPVKDGRDEMMACHNAVCKTVYLSPVGEII